MGKEKSVDTAAIVTLFGGKHQIVSDFEKILKKVLSLKAVEKWVERKAIPMGKVFDLETIAEKRSIEFNFRSFVK